MLSSYNTKIERTFTMREKEKLSYLNSIETLIREAQLPIELVYVEPLDTYRLVNDKGLTLKEGDLPSLNNYLVFKIIK